MAKIRRDRYGAKILDNKALDSLKKEKF